MNVGRRVLGRAAVAALLLVPSLAGCAASPPPIAGVTAECLVCKHEGDLACICVRIEEDTPRCECAGETYYFCSEECKADFAEHPERFLGKE